MAQARPSSVLRYIRRIAGLAVGADPTDQKLLESFAARRDEEAFAALVRRHGPLVWNVCRRVLNHVQDAEDAFQATFLVLARKAAALHWQPEVGNWLYAVAVRTASKARASAGRRRCQEKELVDASAKEPTGEADWDEIRPLLDEEVKRLPEKYRAPVVLCYLKGKTYEEAAQILGWPAGTISGRLARARELLRKQLGRRGLGLSGALVGTFLTRNTVSAALPEGLAGAAVKAALLIAAGQAATVSTPVLTLAKGELQTMFVTKLKLAGAILLATTLLSTGLGWLAYRTLAAEPTAAKSEKPSQPLSKNPDKPLVADQKPAAKPKQETQPITVSGQATDQGKPIEGATIYLVSTNEIDAALGSTTTDNQGRYVFRAAELPIRNGAGAFEVYGTAPGHGFAWHGMRFFHASPRRPGNPVTIPEDLDLYLNEPLVMNLAFTRAARLKGRVVDEFGKPVESVKVHLGSCDYLDTQGKEKANHYRSFGAMHLAPASLTTVVSDQGGRFEFAGLPQEVFFYVLVDHPEFAHVRLFAATTQRPLPDRIPDLEREGQDSPPIATGELNLTLFSPRRVLVQALHADTGKPAPKVKVWVGSSRGDVGSSARGTTDAKGRVALRLPPGEYQVVADPPGDTDYVRTTDKLTVAKAHAEQTLAVQVKPGCVVLFEVTDADTGKGFPKVQILQKRPDWHGWNKGDGLARVWPDTDDTGKLRVVLRPGKARFAVGRPWRLDRYQPAKVMETDWVDLPAGKTVTIPFKLNKEAAPPK
jgi:RNA polymerase sigma factor (sigma-70 family)